VQARSRSSGDRFGAALATGRLGPGIAPGLAVGAPGENTLRGYVNTFNFDRLSNEFVNLHGIALPGAGGVTHGGFGSALAISDFNLDNLGDVVIGAGAIVYSAGQQSYRYDGRRAARWFPGADAGHGARRALQSGRRRVCGRPLRRRAVQRRADRSSTDRLAALISF
jgi:hypothetical protein